MTLLNALLGINWLEQKHQGKLLRDAIAPTPTLNWSPELRAAHEAHIKRAMADPAGSIQWAQRQGALRLWRMFFIGMTDAEKAEHDKAHRHVTP